MHAANTKTVHANGIDITYREIGDGPPLVLLHGALAATGPAWEGSPVAHVDQMQMLGEHFRVIAPDTRGSGETVHPGGPVGFDVLTADVVGLIDALDLTRPAVAGFSEGGAIATLVALEHPDKVGALVNHAGFDYFDPDAMSHQSLRPLFGGRPDATEADPDAAAAAFAQMGPPMVTTFATMQSGYNAAQGDGHWRTYLTQFFDRSVEPFGHTIDDLAKITAPTLILAGDRDHFCPVELACTTFRALDSGQLSILPGAGHDITPAVTNAIIGFIKSPK